ncbi:MAG TPA: methionine synthase [Micromonosporaceae bacterium]
MTSALSPTDDSVGEPVGDERWPVGAATGVGSLPGTDIAEAVKVVLGELPDLPHLPELPARGPGADLIGRGAGLLVELPVELYAGRWRIAGRPGRDLRRTRDLWERDLDTITEQAGEFTGTFKIQSVGPWTLAANLDLPVGGRVLRDPGAARDLVDSLTEGLAGHVRDVRRRLPRARILLQLDEPSLPAVLAGQVPTESGLGTLRAVDKVLATTVLSQVIEESAVPVVVHCCAPRAPIALLRAAGAVAVSLDLDLVEDLDGLGEAIDAGLGLFAGAVPVTGTGDDLSRTAADRIVAMWRRLGFPLARLPEQVVVTPTCGLAGASDEYARTALRACRDAGRRLRDAAWG